MIPDENPFIEFLASLTTEQPDNESAYKKYLAIDPPPSDMLTHSEEDIESFNKINSKVYIWYKRDGKINLETFLKKITNELEYKKHPVNKDVCLSILVYFSLDPGKNKNPVGTINKWIDSICDCDVTQICFINKPYEHKLNYQMPSFNVGVLNEEKLKYKCEKVPSDYYERYKHLMDKKLSIERKVFKIKLLDQSEVYNTLRFASKDDSIYASALWFYFGAVSEVLENDFWQTFDETQHIFVAHGAPYISKEFNVDRFYSGFVSIYMNSGANRQGFVAPKTYNPQVSFASASEQIPRIIKSLREEYKFTEFKQTEIHLGIKRFSKFYCIGTNELDKQNINQAFLNFTICLEIVFGEPDKVSDSIKKRVAVLLSGMSSETFAQKEEEIGKLYSLRSRYVHQGKDIESQDAVNMKLVCKEVFSAMIRLQCEESSHAEGFMKKWKGQLDFFASGFNTDADITESEFQKWGVF